MHCSAVSWCTYHLPDPSCCSAAGDTALTAITDALRIARLHTFLRRLRLLSSGSRRAAAASASGATAASAAASASRASGAATTSDNGSSGGGSDGGNNFLLPGCGVVEVVRATPLRAVLAARPPPLTAGSAVSPEQQEPAAGSLAVSAATQSELRVVIEWLPAAEPRRQRVTAPARAGGRSGAGPGTLARCRVSIAADESAYAIAGERRAPGGAAPPPAAAGAPLAGAAAAPAASVVPDAWYGVLADMAAAGEEGLLLRGLAVAGPPLAALAAATAPRALAAAGWRPGQVTAQSARPPYGVQLLLRKVRRRTFSQNPELSAIRPCYACPGRCVLRSEATTSAASESPPGTPLFK